MFKTLAQIVIAGASKNWSWGLPPIASGLMATWRGELKQRKTKTSNTNPANMRNMEKKLRN